MIRRCSKEDIEESFNIINEATKVYGTLFQKVLIMSLTCKWRNFSKNQVR